MPKKECRKKLRTTKKAASICIVDQYRTLELKKNGYNISSSAAVKGVQIASKECICVKQKERAIGPKIVCPEVEILAGPIAKYILS